MQIAASDVPMMLDEVGRFARERVALAAAHPEEPMGEPVFAELAGDAAELGLLPSAEPDGLGLWGAPDDDASVAFSVGALTAIARANAGVAFAWHRAALARWIAAECALGDAPGGALDLVLAPTGHYGLARGALARWLRAADLDIDDAHLLTDWLDRGVNTTTLLVPRSWRAVLWPAWCNGRLQWQLARRDALDLEECRPPHGFDELVAARVRSSDVPAHLSSLNDAEARAVAGQAYALDWLGLLAIALGSLEHGQALATAFAGIRRQGGKVIAEHPAVQQMLSDIEVARLQAQATLARYTRAINECDASPLAAARAALHPMLRHAANQVMQLHGGIGYMRDAGPEKIVRDQNMLALQGGGALAAHAFVAAWMGAES